MLILLTEKTHFVEYSPYPHETSDQCWMQNASDPSHTHHEWSNGPRYDVACSVCQRQHEKLWIIWRAGLKPFGHFPCANINGRVRVIDGSVPYDIDPCEEKFPRDAIAVPAELASAIWHSDGHYMFDGIGADNVKAIARHVVEHNPRSRHALARYI